MKLMRYGAKGAEKPALVDASGPGARPVGRDSRHHRRDDQAAEPAPPRRARPRQAAGRRQPGRIAPPWSGMGKFICIGLNYSDHAAETGSPIPKEPIIFIKPVSALVGCNDPVVLPQDSVKTRLGGRARRRHRHEGALRRRGRRAEVRRRLLRRQRRLRARVPDRARRHLGQGQGLRHLRPGRPVDGHRRRDREPAGARDVARRQRQAHAERQHQDHDLRRRQAGQLLQPLHDALARRPDHHRHAARRGLGMKPPTYLKAGDEMHVGIAHLGEQRQSVYAWDPKLIDG